MPGKPLVGIVMGSDTDLPVMAEAVGTLKKFQIPFINPKIQVAENQVLFPLVSQRLTFYHKKWKKEDHPCSESLPLRQFSQPQALTPY